LHNSNHDVLFVEQEHKVPKLRAEGLRLIMPDSSTITVKADFRPKLVGVKRCGPQHRCSEGLKAYDTRSATSHVASAGLRCPVVLLQNEIRVKGEAEEVLGRAVIRGPLVAEPWSRRLAW
jgi:ketopantoate reductase